MLTLPTCEHRDSDALDGGLHRCNHPWANQTDERRGQTLGVDDAFCHTCTFDRTAAGALALDQAQRAQACLAALPSGVPPKRPCAHLGEPTGETQGCDTCNGNVQLKIFACSEHGQCTQGRRVAGVACCDAQCREYSPAPAPRSTAVRFGHGFGDQITFAHLLQLYKRRGIDVRVRYNQVHRCVYDAAGIEFAEHPTATHEWPHAPAHNRPGPADDWTENKIAANVSAPPLPDIGDWRQLAGELAEVQLRMPVPAAKLELAKRLLDGLPRPIFLIHSHGSNGQEMKDLPPATCTELYRLLLDQTPGSIVILDWHNRVPVLHDPRVRHVYTMMRLWDPEWLAGIYSLADCLIGIDSGPLHLAMMTELPALGVFHEMYPSTVMLPSPTRACMVRERMTAQNISRRRRWNIIPYAGEMPSAADTARHAIRMAAGPRYLAGHAGRDLMLQQWVRDWLGPVRIRTNFHGAPSRRRPAASTGRRSSRPAAAARATARTGTAPATAPTCSPPTAPAAWGPSRRSTTMPATALMPASGSGAGLPEAWAKFKECFAPTA
jgi:hypothetical protein